MTLPLLPRIRPRAARPFYAGTAPSGRRSSFQPALRMHPERRSARAPASHSSISGAARPGPRPAASRGPQRRLLGTWTP